jgi:hypothetical protein
MSCRRWLPRLTPFLLLPFSALAFAADWGGEQTAAFIEQYCANCHNDVDPEAGLDLTSLPFAPNDPANFQAWVKVHDKLRAGEMPPKTRKKRPGEAELESFLGHLSSTLQQTEANALARDGRTLDRRLNRYEYENAVRDVLHAPWLQVKDQLPEDGEAFRFNKSGQSLDVSHVHMSRYIGAADYALRQLLTVHLAQPATTTRRFYARDEPSLTDFMPRVLNPGPERHTFPVLGTKGQPDVRTYKAPKTVGDANPAIRELEAVGWTHGNYVTGFSSPWTNFRAPVAGRYRVRFSGYTIWVGPGGRSYRFANGSDKVGAPQAPQWYSPNGDDISPGRRYEPITVYAKGGTQNRRLGAFDVSPDPSVQQLDDVWLLANEYLVTDACRFWRSRPGGPVRYQNPLATKEGQPGVAFRWMEIEGPLRDDDSDAGYALLFGNLPLKRLPRGSTAGVALELSAPTSRREGNGRNPPAKIEVHVEVESQNPRADAERLLRGFMANADRRPVTDVDVKRYLDLIEGRMTKGLGFAASMLAGYTAVLSSPAFVYVDEKPGRLDDRALATRLALFTWNSVPDATLRGHAERGDLHRAEVLRGETERLLSDPRSKRFVDAFLDYWLDLRKIDDTTPSTALYGDYYLDDALEEAALDETRLYFSAQLRLNLPARTIVASDFTFLNDRLARHYGIPGVDGIAMRRVALPADSARGGLITQASVLKVTANGTTTSPVLRGKWITDRVLGLEIPPPPASVVAIEPDIRGAVTIRQQLEKHREDKSCALCHSKMDPPGFALESFDVMGAWRDRYRAVDEKVRGVPGIGMNGWPFAFHYGMEVDAKGSLPDGRGFDDVREFKRLLLQDERAIARAFARQLIIYATGAPVHFSERAQLDAILDRAKSSGYGVRSLVHEIVQSDLFLSK